MFRDLMDMSGYEPLAVAAMILFLAVFLVIVVRVQLLRKSFLTKMSNLPFEDDKPFVASHEDRS